jgi:hypothetical protein
VTGGQGPRDWDKELAKIDRLMASGAGQASPPAAAAPEAGAPRRREAAPVPAPAAPGRRSVFFTWVRLLLGLAVGIGITQWPYERGCGVLLFGYLAAVGGVIVAGLWSAVSSWRSRSSLAHMLSMALVVWGGVLGAREVLPRVGYAKASATWMCRVSRRAPAPAPTAPAPQGPAPAPQPTAKTPGAF